jgi:hypothetical protein
MAITVVILKRELPPLLMQKVSNFKNSLGFALLDLLQHLALLILILGLFCEQGARVLECVIMQVFFVLAFAIFGGNF